MGPSSHPKTQKDGGGGGGEKEQLDRAKGTKKNLAEEDHSPCPETWCRGAG